MCLYICYHSVTGQSLEEIETSPHCSCAGTESTSKQINVAKQSKKTEIQNSKKKKTTTAKNTKKVKIQNWVITNYDCTDIYNVVEDIYDTMRRSYNEIRNISKEFSKINNDRVDRANQKKIREKKENVANRIKALFENGVEIRSDISGTQETLNRYFDNLINRSQNSYSPLEKVILQKKLTTVSPIYTYKNNLLQVTIQYKSYLYHWGFKPKAEIKKRLMRIKIYPTNGKWQGKIDALVDLTPKVETLLAKKDSCCRVPIVCIPSYVAINDTSKFINFQQDKLPDTLSYTTNIKQGANFQVEAVSEPYGNSKEIISEVLARFPNNSEPISDTSFIRKGHFFINKIPKHLIHKPSKHTLKYKLKISVLNSNIASSTEPKYYFSRPLDTAKDSSIVDFSWRGMDCIKEAKAEIPIDKNIRVRHALKFDWFASEAPTKPEPVIIFYKTEERGTETDTVVYKLNRVEPHFYSGRLLPTIDSLKTLPSSKTPNNDIISDTVYQSYKTKKVFTILYNHNNEPIDTVRRIDEYIYGIPKEDTLLFNQNYKTIEYVMLPDKKKEIDLNDEYKFRITDADRPNLFVETNPFIFVLSADDRRHKDKENTWYEHQKRREAIDPPPRVSMETPKDSYSLNTYQDYTINVNLNNLPKGSVLELKAIPQGWFRAKYPIITLDDELRKEYRDIILDTIAIPYELTHKEANFSYTLNINTLLQKGMIDQFDIDQLLSRGIKYKFKLSEFRVNRPIRLEELKINCFVPKKAKEEFLKQKEKIGNWKIPSFLSKEKYSFKKTMRLKKIKSKRIARSKPTRVKWKSNLEYIKYIRLYSKMNGKEKLIFEGKAKNRKFVYTPTENIKSIQFLIKGYNNELESQELVTDYSDHIIVNNYK